VGKEGLDLLDRQDDRSLPAFRTLEEIAATVLWPCSPGASYVIGHALTVDGGMTVV
jgi:NAD(P)-dependent dehydrogenase (short-subunit alcohol dehydrogenase family)